MKLFVRLPLLVALIALATLALSGFGVRLGWWTYAVGFQLLEWSAYAGLAAGGVAAFTIVVPALRKGVVASLAVALAIGLVSGYLPWQWRQQARALPKIHDISTDQINPPQFARILPLRATAPNSSVYGGPEIAAAQKLAYPDIQPHDSALAPADAFVRAQATAKAMGWEIVDADLAAGVIEATATTLWFGFKDDVVIRITPAPLGSRIDLRSVSRVGKSDVGANAARIRNYFAKLAT